MAIYQQALMQTGCEQCHTEQNLRSIVYKHWILFVLATRALFSQVRESTIHCVDHEARMRLLRNVHAEKNAYSKFFHPFAFLINRLHDTDSQCTGNLCTGLFKKNA